ncbi:hypothetical protein H710_00022 [Bartonella bacilliformis Ver097]|uniref:Uncharacterized protein n=1 Tax=Bartonella bacilliformis Ver097 TaxID=1293911 RepID=A0A072R7A5_BARBA|nr:hypothetical protein H710_00022 [Bartonella bacilliformis Ver097]
MLRSGQNVRLLYSENIVFLQKNAGFFKGGLQTLLIFRMSHRAKS